MERDEIRKRADSYLELEFHETFREEIKKLTENSAWDDLEDRFYTDLDFGTGGIRGKIGGGFNRINPYIIRKATAGLGAYIRSSGIEEAAVVIAYDSRRYSETFALESALTLSHMGIKSFLFSSLRPTPELSYAVRKLGATAGVVITASHNPPEYNGYKVYWSDGGQIVPPHDSGIIEKVRKVTGRIEAMQKEKAIKSGMLEIINSEIDKPYREMIKSLTIHPELFEKYGKDCNVVFTPLHGTGFRPVVNILSDLGLEVITVPEQSEPDGEFPTVEYPNPEEASALEMAIALGRRENADLVMATDPDADRLGIAVPDNGSFRLVTGNQLGVLLCDYIFSQLAEAGKLPENPALVKTVVTTELQALIAKKYNAHVFDVLTGFKYIAEKIREFEKSGYNYVFGGEESYGYLVGTEVRDKDAVSAAAMTAEMTLHHVSKGKTVLKRLEEIYREFGYFEEILISKKFEGQEGKQKIRGIMDALRNERPGQFAGRKIVRIKDYLERKTFDAEKHTESSIDLPKSNVIQFILDDESIISIRPSGTEPKIKFYASCRTEPGVDLEKAKKTAAGKLDAIRRDLEALTG